MNVILVYQLLVPLIVGFGAAWLGAYLTKRWTPDLRPEFKSLGSELKTELETLERERAEFENLPLEIRLQYGYSDCFQVTVKNLSQESITLEAIDFEWNRAPLCQTLRPRR